jgi:hypothetical protein
MEHWKKLAGGEHQENDKNRHFAEEIKRKTWHLGDLVQRQNRRK